MLKIISNKAVSVVLMLLVSTVLLAQPALNWGPENKQKSNSGISSLVAEDDAGIVILRYESPHSKYLYHLERYDKSTNELLTSGDEIEFSPSELEIYMSRVELIGDNLYALTTAFDKKAGSYSFYYQLIDKKSLNLVGTSKLIASMPVDGAKDLGAFNWSFSEDRSKILLRLTPNFKKGNTSDKIRCLVFDTNWTLIWETEVIKKYSDEADTYQSFRLSNSGAIYGLDFIYANDNNDKSKRTQKLVAWKLAEQKPMQTYPLETDGYFFKSVNWTLNEALGLIIYAGAYSKVSDENFIGTYYHTLNASTLETVAKKATEIPWETRKQFVTDEELGSGEVEISNLNSLNSYFQPDGGLTFIAERYRTVLMNSTDPNNRDKYWQHIYGDLLISRINNDGTVAWNIKLPRHEMGGTKGANTYIHVNLNGTTYIIMKDYQEHFDENKGKDPKGKNRFERISSITTITEAGKVTRTRLNMPNIDDNLLFPIQVTLLTKKNELIVVNDGLKTYRLGKVTFK